MAKKQQTIKIPVANVTKAIAQQASAPRPVESISSEQIKWRAEDALRDIERAEKHKSDPKLMSEVKKLAKQKVNNLKKIC